MSSKNAYEERTMDDAPLHFDHREALAWAVGWSMAVEAILKQNAQDRLPKWLEQECDSP